MNQDLRHTDKETENRGSRRMFLAAGVSGAAAGLWGRGASAQGGGRGRGGPGWGRARGRGARNDPTFEADHDAIQTLLGNRSAIRRRVTNLPNGVETLTETDDERLRDVLIQHVEAMYDRLEDGRPIHQRDPLFAELFRHREQIVMSMELTERGIRVTETSDDPHVVRLIQSHAEVVSLFLKHGRAEVRKNHAVPG